LATAELRTFSLLRSVLPGRGAGERKIPHPAATIMTSRILYDGMSAGWRSTPFFLGGVMRRGILDLSLI
jgi:hypothetical protein